MIARPMQAVPSQELTAMSTHVLLFPTLAAQIERQRTRDELAARRALRDPVRIHAARESLRLADDAAEVLAPEPPEAA